MKNITEKEFYLLLENQEYENLEFKEAKSSYSRDKVIEYCVALANEGGGKLILGVADKTHKIVGTNAFNTNIINNLQNNIADKLNIKVIANEVHIKQKRIIIFDIPSRHKGIALNIDGKYLMRAGESLKPMTQDMLRSIFMESQESFMLTPILSGLTDSEILNAIDTRSFFALQRLPYPSNSEEIFNKLLSESFITKSSGKYNITCLGAILFAYDITTFDAIKHKSVRVIVYNGSNKTEMLKEQIGVKGYAICFKGLIDYIDSQLPVYESLHGAIRETIREFPLIAIRELVANALIHQDFLQTGMRVTIEIYNDRVVVSNPGTPIINQNRFLDEYQSRNEDLASFMRRIGICEEQGSGIDKVVQAIEETNLPPYEISVSSNRTNLTIFKQKSFDELSKGARLAAAFQHCVLCYLDNNKMSNQSLRKRLGLGDRESHSASRVIKDAMQNNLIKLDEPENSSKKYARYIPAWA